MLQTGLNPVVACADSLTSIGALSVPGLQDQALWKYNKGKGQHLVILLWVEKRGNEKKKNQPWKCKSYENILMLKFPWFPSVGNVSLLYVHDSWCIHSTSTEMVLSFASLLTHSSQLVWETISDDSIELLGLGMKTGWELLQDLKTRQK